MNAQESSGDAPPSKNQVRKAGRVVRKHLQHPIDPTPEGHAQALEEYEQAILVIERHRAAHSQPMLTANVFLRRACAALAIEGRVTQRLKRMETIREKLLREPGELDRMQDLGGCRVVMPTIADAYRLRDYIVERRRIDRCTDYIDRCTDYIESPRLSGYRAIHIVAPFGNTVCKPVEIQIRTLAMHEWATMVEETSGILGINYKQDGHTLFQSWASTLSEIMALQESSRPVPPALWARYTDGQSRLFADLEGGHHDG